MINFYPQRWNYAFIPFAGELIRKRIKNVVKKWMIKIKGRGGINLNSQISLQYGEKLGC